MKKISLLLIAGLVAAVQAHAQDAATTTTPFFYDKLFSTLILVVAGLVILGAIIALYSLLSAMIKVQQIKIYQEQGMTEYAKSLQSPPSIFGFLKRKLDDAVPVEREKEIMLDHGFDGIRELDNNLPPWWVAMFYITIIFGAVYMFYYHFLGIGPSSKEEYEMAVKAADEQVAAFRSQSADQVDENTVTALTEAGALDVGKILYTTNCVACHGSLGEGGVGPNLTDEYWVHGGTIKDVFKTITYGVPEKGMISWKTQLRPAQIQQVASYILTLQGTNPPNGKQPEGTKASEAPAMTQDTTQAVGMTGGQ